MENTAKSDHELVQQLKSGGMHAGAELYSRYKQPVYSFCLRMLPDAEGAHDAVQETFLSLISKIHSVRNGESVRSWLFSVARNEVLMVLRRRQTVRMEPLDGTEPVYDPVTPHITADRNELRQHLEAAIRQLRPSYREVYLLREAEGMTYDEIAAVTGLTISAVKSKLFKTRTALHELLAPYMNERER